MEQTTKGERAFDLFSRLLKESIVFLGTPVDDAVANLVCANCCIWRSEDPDKDISLYINSPGGDINSLFAIYDTMQYIKPDITTICFGQAASAAAVLLAAGTQGKRLALPHARILIHQPYAGAHGQAGHRTSPPLRSPGLKASLEQVLAFHTGQSIERIATDTDRDFVMTPQQAQDYGIIDEVIQTAASSTTAAPSGRSADARRDLLTPGEDERTGVGLLWPSSAWAMTISDARFATSLRGMSENS